MIVERLVEKEKSIKPSEMSRIRQEVESSMKTELADKKVDVDPTKLAKVFCLLAF